MSYKGILHILPQLNGGGVEWAVIDLSHFLQETGRYKVIVASNGGKLVTQLTNNGIEHISLPLHIKNPWRLWTNAKLLAAIIEEKKIDLIHVHSRAPAWTSLIVSFIKKIPLVTTYHGAYGQGNFLKKIYNSSMVMGNATIAISRFISDHILTYYPSSKHHLIYEGIDVDYFVPIFRQEAQSLRQKWLKDKEFLIVLPGRFTKIKGHNILLQALKELPAIEKIQTIFVGPSNGSTDYIDELKNTIQQYNLPVDFVNDVEDIRLVYQACDLVVCPSTKPEAFGRVVAEAMAMEKVVIGFDHGATPELLDKNSLVKPQDYMGLKDLILSFAYMNKKVLQTIGTNNREKICKFFDLKTMGGKTVKLYEQLLN